LHPKQIPPEFPSKFLYPNFIQILNPNIVKNVARIPHDSNVADIMSPTFFVKKCRRRCRRHLKNVADIFTVISVVITRILDGFTGVATNSLYNMVCGGVPMSVMGGVFDTQLMYAAWLCLCFQTKLVCVPFRKLDLSLRLSGP